MCMRTTVTIQDDLLRRAKALAAETDRTLSDVVTDALRVLFQQGAEARAPALPVARYSEPAPGVDLTPRGLRDLLAAEDEERWR